jgi:hypothetical protein
MVSAVVRLTGAAKAVLNRSKQTKQEHSSLLMDSVLEWVALGILINGVENSNKCSRHFCRQR